MERTDPEDDARSATVVPFDAPTSPTDEAAVRATVDDYFLGWYDADPERMRRALHPLLAKRGWTREEGGVFELGPVTAEEMIDSAGAGQGRRSDLPIVSVRPASSRSTIVSRSLSFTRCRTLSTCT